MFSKPLVEVLASVDTIMVQIPEEQLMKAEEKMTEDMMSYQVVI